MNNSADLTEVCQEVIKFFKNGDPVKDVIENTPYSEEELIYELALAYIAALRASAAPEEGGREALKELASDIKNLELDLARGCEKGFVLERLNAAANKIRRALSPDSRKAEPGAWHSIENWRLDRDGPHVLGYRDGEFGVAEYRFFQEGGWSVAAFNGQIIRRAPEVWRPMPKQPKYPTDEVAALAPATEDGGREALGWKDAQAAAEAVCDYTDNNLSMMEACDMPEGSITKAQELHDAAKRLRDMFCPALSPSPSVETVSQPSAQSKSEAP